MKTARLWALAGIAAVLTGCSPSRETAATSDPELEREIAQIKAIDNHAHPMRVTAVGEAADRGFDALPVDNMEPMSDPVNLRPGSPMIADAARELFGGTDPQLKARAIKEHGAAYPAWVLDKMGIEIMVANRVTMGSSVEPPRFRWAAYADALLFPLDTAKLKERNSDRKAFFALEDKLRQTYFESAGVNGLPGTLGEYLSKVVTPTLERHRQGGAIAEKFEASYLRPLAFDKVERAAADRAYAQRRALSEEEYKPLGDFLFRYIAMECGRLGMAVHVHTGEGAGGYYDVAGGNPMNLQSVLIDPELRKTNFVMVHGGWPYVHEAAALLTRPNAYLDFSMQPLLLGPSNVAQTLREWLTFEPEKVMFASDAYPYSEEMGWEEAGMAGARAARKALALALTGMVRDGEITRARASVLARMVLRENAKKLYGL
jgi:predicted TIM-barrel fold metal-dependent hydrolase